MEAFELRKGPWFQAIVVSHKHPEYRIFVILNEVKCMWSKTHPSGALSEGCSRLAEAYPTTPKRFVATASGIARVADAQHDAEAHLVTKTSKCKEALGTL